MSVDTTALVVACVALVSAMGAAGVSARGARKDRIEAAEMEDKKHAQRRVERYQEPLVRSAYELQSRLWNIARGNFLARYEQASDERANYAADSTAWLVGQYLCWVEILRRETQYLKLEAPDTTTRLQEVLEDITQTFGHSGYNRSLRIFRAKQRAIGELLVVEGRDAVGGSRTDCMGFALFTSRLEDPTFERWFASLREDVQHLARHTGGTDRLVRLQGLLIDLVNLVDPLPGIRFRKAREALPAWSARTAQT